MEDLPGSFPAKGGAAMSSPTARRDKIRKAKVTAGTWLYQQPIGPVRAHLVKLTRQQGMTIQEVAATSGVPVQTLYKIRGGWSTGKWAHGETAARIMAVEAPKRACHEIQPNGRSDLVNATATRRRIQAMARMAYTLKQQAAAAGMAKSSLMCLILPADNPRRV